MSCMSNALIILTFSLTFPLAVEVVELTRIPTIIMQRAGLSPHLLRPNFPLTILTIPRRIFARRNVFSSEKTRKMLGQAT